MNTSGPQAGPGTRHGVPHEAETTVIPPPETTENPAPDMVLRRPATDMSGAVRT